MPKNLNFLTGSFQEIKAPSKKKLPEAKVRDEILSYFKKQDAYARQINSGGTMRGGAWHTSGQGVGIADILCWLPFARFIAVEVKAPGKKRTATEMQHKFLRNIISRGMHGCIADSIKDVEVCLGQSREEQLATLDALVAKKRVRDGLEAESLFE